MKKTVKFSFERRTAFCFFVIVLLLFICFLRIFSIILSPKYKVTASEGHHYIIDAGNLRGTIFDRNMHPITNAEEKTMAAVLPTPRSLAVLRGVLSDEEMLKVTEKIKEDKPFLITLPEEVTCDGIICFKVPENLGLEQNAVHLVGYCDASGHGVTGLQSAFDDLLNLDGKITVTYAKDGHSNILKGIDGVLENTSNVLNTGVISTLDINLQKILEDATKTIKKGCAIICEAKTGEILAAVSLPSFSPTNIEAATESPDSPLLNRIFCSYNIGSVFKPCAALSAMTSGAQNTFSHTCAGFVTIDGHTFNCHKLSGHGKVSLDSALALSCNTFFYKLSILTGAESLYKTATIFGFGSSITLCNKMSTYNESITPLKTLKASNSALANLAIGQGELLASPLTLLNLYNAIANEGKYYTPTLIKGTMKNGKISEEKHTAPTRAMSKECAQNIKYYLNGVIEKGTGTKAKPENTTAAGKTATAETGWKNESGKLISQSWFCGFFPLEAPKYTVIILAEDSVSGGEDCAPVFKAIAEKITEAGY